MKKTPEQQAKPPVINKALYPAGHFDEAGKKVEQPPVKKTTKGGKK